MNLNHYKKRLLELEKSLVSRTELSGDDARRQILDTAHDTGDASVASIMADDAFTQVELDSTILSQVRDALIRIDDGTYGKCTVDGGPIETKRLDAVPWTPYCLKHQSLIEASSRERNWTM
jgi:DnaK suppressor protein